MSKIVLIREYSESIARPTEAAAAGVTARFPDTIEKCRKLSDQQKLELISIQSVTPRKISKWYKI